MNSALTSNRLISTEGGRTFSAAHGVWSERMRVHAEQSGPIKIMSRRPEGTTRAGLTRPPRVAFVMEQALGHVTYHRNLHAAFSSSDRLEPVWLPVPFKAPGLLDVLPGPRDSWTVRGSLRAYMAIRALRERSTVDAMFLHTQTVALLAPLAVRNMPTIISLDATPINYDTVGVHYGHQSQPGSPVERLKRSIYSLAFQRANALTCWSEWAKRSLEGDYGVDPDRVEVIPPGVDVELFGPSAEARHGSNDDPIRILFVGGDFERKGGRLLLECMRGGLGKQCELHLVTRYPVQPSPGVHVYSDLGPNDPRLISLYRRADIFALPTYADCLAVVLGEAMAAGLPVVTTSVAGQPEAVQDGRTGFIVPPGDPTALGRALSRLAGDRDLRESMGRAGRVRAVKHFNATANAGRLADVILSGIEHWAQR
jgi:glycosyltransferase involved in cell wall biosynthesis